MSWEREPLWTKSKLYFERAFDVDRSDDVFGLWCAMGLELLSRSTVSYFSPVLLAEPDKEHRHVLSALGFGTTTSQRKSIATSQVLRLCKELIPKFTDDELTIASALAGRRNEELHSGAAAFMEYKHQQWIGGFYKCCKILAEAQGESLTSLFGDGEAKTAEQIIQEVEGEVTNKVRSKIAAYAKVFGEKGSDEQKELKDAAEKQGEKLSHQQHHKVQCPACKCVATVQGDTYGREQIENREDEIVVRQSVIPTKFLCDACGLKLTGYGELLAANVADHFTHRAHYTPSEFYELVDPNDREAMDSYAEDHGYFHFSND
jgi:phage FluMu protein Com